MIMRYRVIVCVVVFIGLAELVAELWRNWNVVEMIRDIELMLCDIFCSLGC